MCSNNNFDGDYYAIIGPELSISPGNPDYQGTLLYTFRVCVCVCACSALW